MYEYLRVNISILVIWYASNIKGCDNDKRTSELSNAPLHMTQDTTRIKLNPLNLKLRLRLTCNKELVPEWSLISFIVQ